MKDNNEELKSTIGAEETDFFDTSFEKMEEELDLLMKKDRLKIEIDQGMEQSLRELEELSKKVPQEQVQTLFDLCAQNAVDTVVGSFGLVTVLLDSQDGGNVDTTHNVRKGIWASEEEKQKYENKSEYNSAEYHQDSKYKEINKQESEKQKQGKSKDYITGKKISPNEKTDLDHIVSAKTIHDDRARVLAEVDGPSLANSEDNLKLTASSLNRSKKDKTPTEWRESIEQRMDNLIQKSKKKPLNEQEQNELKKLKKYKKDINEEELERIYKEQKKKIDRQIDKEYYTSFKPYKQAVITGAKDAFRVTVYSALGLILKEFITAMILELKKTFREFGNESITEIFKRFKDRANFVWNDINTRWKEVFNNSIEAGIQAFFSNLLVFVINTVFTTLRRVVQIIRASFTSLWKAVKIISNPPEGMSQDEVMLEASKIFITGMISSVALFGADVIEKWLMTIPGMNVLITFPLPFSNETIGSALSVCISAALGAIVSTIVIFYIDKWRNDSNISKIRVQIVNQGGVVLNYKIAQTWFALDNAYSFLQKSLISFREELDASKQKIQENFEATQREIELLQDSSDFYELFNNFEEDRRK